MSVVSRVLVIGAGAGGLTAAMLLAHAGHEVTVLERTRQPGGKLSTVTIGDATIDVGPTVFTMRWVFEQVFAAIGERLEDALTLSPLATIARHSWSDSERLDLFANIDESEAAIARFSGVAESHRFRKFCERARRTYDTLERPFIMADRPRLVGLARDLLPHRVADLWSISPFRSLWNVLGDYFHDPRLRQLFGRYATYCGGTPWLSPGTLMLLAHVERSGVWSVEGGMHRIAECLATRAIHRGAKFRYGEHVARICAENSEVTGVVLESGEQIEANVVISNVDIAAISSGLFDEGARSAAPSVVSRHRSLSAFTLALIGNAKGFDLHRHNVFFSNDYEREFSEIVTQSSLPRSPTVYVCAQDRDDQCFSAGQQERLFCIVNAPAIGDTHHFDEREIERCEEATFSLLRRHGLHVEHNTQMTRRSSPTDFAHRFPGTGGALYGRAPHGWMSSFQRTGARTKIRGLYLTGGSTHPGPGVAMAALSGHMAATQVKTDLALIGK